MSVDVFLAPTRAGGREAVRPIVCAATNVALTRSARRIITLRLHKKNYMTINYMDIFVDEKSISNYFLKT